MKRVTNIISTGYCSSTGERNLSTVTDNRHDQDLAFFFEHSRDLQCIADQDWLITQLNPAWTGVLGWSMDALKSRPLIDFVDENDLPSTLAATRGIRERNRVVRFENRFQHADGSYRYLRWTARSESENGQIYASARDISEEKRYAREIVEIVDREKELLGCELHDGLCQSLTGIAALSATLSRKLASSSNKAADEAMEISELLYECISQARELSHSLVPRERSRDGCDKMLGDFAASIERMFGISCVLRCTFSFPRLPQETESNLCRIAQEAVNNALVHGRANQIEILLSRYDDLCILRVLDNGVGLERNKAESGSHGIGLQTMAYRARLISGVLEVGQRRRCGTSVTCRFPLPQRRNTAKAKPRANKFGCLP
jgi:PAS domain S-box-containing protein